MYSNNHFSQSRHSEDQDSNSLSWLGLLLDPCKTTNETIRHQSNHLNDLLNSKQRDQLDQNINFPSDKADAGEEPRNPNQELYFSNTINIQNPSEDQAYQGIQIQQPLNQCPSQQAIVLNDGKGSKQYAGIIPNFAKCNQNPPFKTLINSISSLISKYMPLDNHDSSSLKEISPEKSKDVSITHIRNQNQSLPNSSDLLQGQEQFHQRNFGIEVDENEKIEMAPKRKKINKNLRLINKRRVSEQYKLEHQGQKHQDQIQQSIEQQLQRSKEHEEIGSVVDQQVQLQKQNSVQDQHQDVALLNPSRNDRLSPRQQKISQQFESIIKIISHKCIDDDIKYKWEFGTLRLWNTIEEALRSNFYIFIKHSTKFKSKFEKYIPSKSKIKTQIANNQLKVPHNIKMERIRQTRIKNKRIELANLKQIFNQIQISKIIHYQKQFSKSHSSSEVDQNQYSEYEPQSPLIQSMIEELVVRTNKKIAAKNRHKMKQNKEEGLKAMDELFIYKLNKASQKFDYVNNMNEIFSFNAKAPTLSCLSPEGLGLRSSNLKVITKQDFQRQMKSIRMMNQAKLLSDQDSNEREEGSGKINSKLQ